MDLTKREINLISYLRKLTFDDLFDATMGITREAQKALEKGSLAKAAGDSRAPGWYERSSNLSMLSELLGDANEDYYSHMNGNENLIQMEPSSADEVLYLFKVLEKFDAGCSVEFKINELADPLFSTGGDTIKSEYLERANNEHGDAIVVFLGDATEFGFNIKDRHFSKLVRNNQITILIAGDEYAAWFDSRNLPEKAIQEANSYAPPVKEEHFAIDVRNTKSVAEKLGEIVDHLNQGYSIAGIDDCVGESGHLYIDLVRGKCHHEH